MRSWNGRLFALLLCGASLASCHTGSASTLAGATSMTALALGTAAAERAAGGCIAICTAGTTCNPRTGLCERAPCEGRCSANEVYEETFSGSKCVAATTVVAAKADGSSTVRPIAPIVTTPDANHPSPTIVPSAEQRDVPK